MKYYAILSNAERPRGYYVRAEDLRQALRTYALCTFADEDEAGNLRLKESFGEDVRFVDEIEAIECCEKAVNTEWNIMEYHRPTTKCGYTPIFCGQDRGTYEDYVNWCREQHGDSIALPPGAFMWLLWDEAIVTFHEEPVNGHITPADIKYRFTFDFNSATFRQARIWSGDNGDIMSGLSQRLYEVSHMTGIRAPIA